MSTSPEALGLLVKTVQHRHHRALDGALGEVGISLVQWNALREIDRNPAASMHRLAELTFNSDQAFGTLAARLLRAGLIERRQGPGRVLAHVLTTRGEALLKEGADRHAAVLHASFAALSAGERDTLGRLLARLARPLSTGPAPDASSTLTPAQQANRDRIQGERETCRIQAQGQGLKGEAVQEAVTDCLSKVDLVVAKRMGCAQAAVPRP